MKVVTVSLLEEIQEQVKVVEKAGKRVRYIELTESEVREIRQELAPMFIAEVPVNVPNSLWGYEVRIKK